MKKTIIKLAVILILLTPLSNAEESLENVSRESKMLLQLKQKLAETEYRYFSLQNNKEKAKEGLDEVEKAIESLEGAIKNINANISETESEIINVKSQIEKKKLEVKKTEKNIEKLALSIEDQKEIVSNLLRFLYVRRDIYYDGADVNPIKVLASNDSISTTLQKVTFLDLMEAENALQIDKLADLDTALKENWQNLRKKKKELDALDAKLAEELLNLEIQKEGQTNLLNETKGDEAVYKAMLENSDLREEELIKEIEIYERNVKEMEERLSGVKGALSDDEKKIIEQIEAEASDDFEVADAASELEFDWPVSPARGLTAHFIDSAYVALFGVQHYALDIRANHGSPIFAPADGIVYTLVFDDKSTRYAYIMVAHRKGVMTVYGHISGSSVKAGEYVKRGAIIGFTGGTPGTVGSGVRTTGPHLHFEVWQDGVRVDPLKYLPLSNVPLDDLPQEYIKDIQDKLEQEIREIQNALNS